MLAVHLPVVPRRAARPAVVQVHHRVAHLLQVLLVLRPAPVAVPARVAVALRMLVVLLTALATWLPMLVGTLSVP